MVNCTKLREDKEIFTYGMDYVMLEHALFFIGST